MRLSQEMSETAQKCVRFQKNSLPALAYISLNTLTVNIRSIPELKKTNDFENIGCEAVPKTVSRIKIAAESESRVPEALRPINKIKMVADFENMGYEVVTKTVSRIKMAV